MKITKYGHSCLLVEEGGKKLLIDPGSYTFDKDVTPKLVGPVDVIVITHHHADHMDAGAIKQFLNMQPVVVIGSQQIRNDLQTEGIEAVTLEPGQQQVAGFTVEAIEATHERIPGPIPENYAYLINGVLLHPGDSYDISRLPLGIKVLALPTQGPWAKAVESIEMAAKLRPEYVIPIHNAIYKDAIGEKFDERIAMANEQSGTHAKLLKIGESWDLS